MVEFFDRLRVDKKLDDALDLTQQIDDEAIKSRLKVLLALDFAGVGSNPGEGVLASTLKQDGFLASMLYMAQLGSEPLIRDHASTVVGLSEQTNKNDIPPSPSRF
jgi:hypothetical protein